MASHGDDTEALLGGEKKQKHSHSHGDKKKKKHSHSHGEKEHGHSHAKKHKKKKKKTSSCWAVLCDIKLLSFIVIGGLTLLYCIAELGMAIYLGSLTLLSDGFHNLSDVIALYIAFWAAQASKRDVSDSMSYGWVRSEILGGLTNGCFLLSLCLYVTLESIPRFIKPTAMTSGWPFIGVAAAGLAVNTIGTLVFAATGMSHGHSHSHGGGHGHSHGGHGHAHGDKEKKKKHGHAHGDKKKKDKDHGHGHGHGHGKKKKKSDGRCGFDMNTWAVFIHYAGDMVSSLVVLIMGFLIKFVPEGKWMDYIDPAASLVIVVLILWTTVPLVKDCSMILLQSTPSDLELSAIRTELRDMAGVENVHDLHVWQLVDGMTISSVHLAVEEGTDFSHIADEAKGIFHEHGIHSSTIQPEFVPKNYPDKPFCESNCVKDCDEDWCCKKTADRHKAEKEDDDHGHQPSLRQRHSHSHGNGHDDHDDHHDHGHDDHDHDHGHGHDDHDHDHHDHDHHHHDEENGNGSLLHDDDDDILPRRSRPGDPSLLINI